MKTRNLEKENKRLKQINLVPMVYVIVSIVIQLYNMFA